MCMQHLLEDHVGITKKSAEEIQNILRDNNIENLKSMVQQLVTEEYSPTISKPKSSTIPITSLVKKKLIEDTVVTLFTKTVLLLNLLIEYF